MDILGRILPKDHFAVSIVGTRKPSLDGKKLAHDFAFYLAANDVTVVSGMARGIDTIAHRGAIEAGGRTIAVLGCGIDITYPPENKSLMEEIVRHGAVVSEFSRGTKPFPSNFLIRNRLVAKLGLCILVIEGAARSGTLSTASWAADLGREVFVIPGSPATDYLITQGATVAKSPKVVLDYLNAVSNS